MDLVYRYRVTLEVQSRLDLDDDLIDKVFDAMTDSMPPVLGVFDQRLTSNPKLRQFEFQYDIEDVESMDVAGAWTLVAFRNAMREVAREVGDYDQMVEVTQQTITKWSPELPV